MMHSKDLLLLNASIIPTLEMFKLIFQFQTRDSPNKDRTDNILYLNSKISKKLFRAIKIKTRGILMMMPFQMHSLSKRA